MNEATFRKIVGEELDGRLEPLAERLEGNQTGFEERLNKRLDRNFTGIQSGFMKTYIHIEDITKPFSRDIFELKNSVDRIKKQKAEIEELKLDVAKLREKVS